MSFSYCQLAIGTFESFAILHTLRRIRRYWSDPWRYPSRGRNTRSNHVSVTLEKIE